MIIETITIQAGRDKQGNPESISGVDLRPGDSLALVGPTGSGKSELLSDIEQAACGDTRSGRTILINGRPLAETPTGLVATLSQKTNFVMDASVEQFILLHAESKGRDGKALMAPLLEMTNSLCGEPVSPEMSLQVLSGGQSRALMIADIALLSDTPIVLIDEVENAGIHKFKALEVLAGHHKIVISATHDPVLILMNDTRLVMRNGAMAALLSACDGERAYADRLRDMDDTLMQAREILRQGHTLNTREAL
ncbi:ATP-binding cassette domain-containing protein [Salidesulfovibrio onnuriiensis]|uniref:ATP-binding cassette domain-containing protein n=1 Tax=Salidesulfovibrio onnuriiensis TaxID=2583823 RepID=UPI0011CBBEAC|nr:ATP-binding cassette domain-containing protein [Salidesulfovibrio onnuriiensis]